jgi:hypothetical protein
MMLARALYQKDGRVERKVVAFKAREGLSQQVILGLSSVSTSSSMQRDR